jgi:hypothetical protein
VRREAHGVRILPCLLPIKSPWLNPIEPRWIHAQRKVVEPARLLTAAELEDRVRHALGGPREKRLALPPQVA